jgi:hypothetical protein
MRHPPTAPRIRQLAASSGHGRAVVAELGAYPVEQFGAGRRDVVGAFAEEAAGVQGGGQARAVAAA